MAYIVDSNCFIEPANRFYCMDICPAFWDWIDEQHVAGRLFSIDKVEAELQSPTDLVIWAGRQGPGFFLSVSDTATVAEFGPIATFAQANFAPRAAGHFLNGADPWLIAYAKAYNHTIITHEKFETNARKPKIPNFCRHFGVPYTDLTDVIRLSGRTMKLS